MMYDDELNSLRLGEKRQLGKWYVELILLKSFGFNGKYACRLNIPRSAGSVEPVPDQRPKSPHLAHPFPHLNIDSNSLNSYHTTERKREYVEYKALS